LCPKITFSAPHIFKAKPPLPAQRRREIPLRDDVQIEMQNKLAGIGMQMIQRISSRARRPLLEYR